jgi:hypothetical protein
MVQKKRKKLIAVQSDVITQIIRIANTKGRTVYSFVNEIMEQAIEAEEVGRSLKEIVEMYKLMEIEKKTGSILVPREILNFLIQRLYPSEKDALLKEWYSSGQWYGKYIKARIQEGEPLETLDKLLQAYAWDSSEIRVIRGNGPIRLRCISPKHTPEETRLFSKFLEGAMHSMGYNLKEKEVMKGLILLNFDEER